MKAICIGNRVPKRFFITGGVGESDITVHAGSYHLALRDAGIEMFNIMQYSSILPRIAKEVDAPIFKEHGAVLETIMAVATSEDGDTATAGIIFGWLYDKGEKYGGLVCEFGGARPESYVDNLLRKSLEELHCNGYEHMELRDVQLIIRSVRPQKRYGTAIVGLCFIDYDVPVIVND